MSKERKTGVGKLLQKIGNAIASIFHKLDDVTKAIIPIASEIVNNMKLITDSHIGDVLTAIIPGTLDDKAYQKLKDFIPKALSAIALADEFANIEDPNEKIRAILSKINIAPTEGKKLFYRGLASLFLECLADGDLDWADSGKISDYYYENEDLLKEAA